MNQFDRFIKHTLKVKYYIRYTDDFVIFSSEKKWLTDILRYIVRYLREKLCLELHPDKISIRTVASGVDYLGWVNFPNYRVLRTSTKRRMFKRLTNKPKKEVVCSYLGLLRHGNAQKLKEKIVAGFPKLCDI